MCRAIETQLKQTGNLYTKASTKQTEGEKKSAYFSGTYIEDRDAPMPGVPCLTGLFVTANSPK